MYRSRFSGPMDDSTPMTATDATNTPSTKSGRRKKWVAAVVKEEELLRAKRWYEMYAPKPGSRARVRADFEEFCRLNLMAIGEDALLPWIGQMITSNLRAGTVREYVKFAVIGMRSSPFLRSVTEATERAYADEEEETATEVWTVEEVRLFLLSPGVQSAPLPLKSLVYIMVITGWRHVDVWRLRRRALRVRFELLKQSGLLATIRWSKTITRRAGRRSCMFPLVITEVPADVLAFLHDGEETEKLFVTATYRSCMAVMKSHKAQATTYTLRYSFIAWALHHHQGRKQIVANRYTLHKDTSCLESFYTQWVARGDAQEWYENFMRSEAA